METNGPLRTVVAVCWHPYVRRNMGITSAVIVPGQLVILLHRRNMPKTINDERIHRATFGRVQHSLNPDIWKPIP